MIKWWIKSNYSSGNKSFIVFQFHKCRGLLTNLRHCFSIAITCWFLFGSTDVIGIIDALSDSKYQKKKKNNHFSCHLHFYHVNCLLCSCSIVELVWKSLKINGSKTLLCFFFSLPLGAEQFKWTLILQCYLQCTKYSHSIIYCLISA